MNRIAWIMDRVMLTDSGCWIWNGAASDSDHAVAFAPWKRHAASAYRVSYEVFVGNPPPHGMDLHHECRNGRCVNPTHVRPVSRQENLLIGLMDRKIWPATHICPACRHKVQAAGQYHRECRKAAMLPKRRQRIIEAMQRWATVYGRSPSALDWNIAMARNRGYADVVNRYESGDWPATSQVQKVFGSWSAALAASGLASNPTGRPGHWRSLQEAVA